MLGGVFGKIRDRPDGGLKSGLIRDSGTGTNFVAACSGLEVSEKMSFSELLYVQTMNQAYLRRLATVVRRCVTFYVPNY